MTQGLHRSAAESAEAAGPGERLPLGDLLRLFRRSIGFLRPLARHLLVMAVGFTLLGTLLTLLGAPLLSAFSNGVLLARPLTGLEAALLFLGPEFTRAGELSDARQLEAALRILFAFGALSVVAVPGLLGLYYYLVWILQRVNHLLRMRILEKLQRLSMRFHSSEKPGDAIYRMYQDSSMVTKLIELLMLEPAFALGRHLFGFCFVALLDLGLALAMLACWPFYLGLGFWGSQRLRTGFRRARETNSTLTSRIQESLTNIRVVKAYHAEAFEQERFESDSREAFRAAYTARGRFAFFAVSAFWIAATALALGGGVAALYTIEQAELGALIALTGYLAWNFGVFNVFKERFSDGAGSLRRLFRAWADAQNMAVGLNRVFEILDLEVEVRDARDAVPLQEIGSGVRFAGVHFHYRPEQAVLQDVSFSARPGEITALVGPTGSGKTTLMSLLLRLYDPQQGRVLIGGRDLRSFQTASLRRQIAVVLQENLLFSASVRENIRYAQEHASDAAVREAARTADALDFIETLPEGFDTMLGERGAKLSTGQRARLQVARAVLVDAPILVLDEPTASLDAESEVRLLAQLSQWGRGRLIFLVTHRLRTAQNADRIVVLEAGRVVEAGAPAALASRPGGAWRRMLEHESAGRAHEAQPVQGGLPGPAQARAQDDEAFGAKP